MLQKMNRFSPALSDDASRRNFHGLCAGLVIGLLLVLPGCSTKLPDDRHVVSPLTLRPPPSNGAVLDVYKLNVGDKMSIRFFYDPALDTEVIVRPDGRISLQLVGEILVIGLTPEQLRRRLVKLYSGFLNKPEVAVIVDTYQQQDVYIAGQVRAPGKHALKSGLTVLQAIILSGSFTYGAERRSVIVIRHDADGKPLFIRVDLEAFMANALPNRSKADDYITDNEVAMNTDKQLYGYDMQLRPADIVYVPETSINSVAQFFDKHLGAIIPIYRNMGFSFTYELSDEF